MRLHRGRVNLSKENDYMQGSNEAIGVGSQEICGYELVRILSEGFTFASWNFTKKHGSLTNTH